MAPQGAGTAARGPRAGRGDRLSAAAGVRVIADLPISARQAEEAEGPGACADDRGTDPACEDTVTTTTTTTRPQPRPSPDGPRASRPATQARPEPEFLT